VVRVNQLPSELLMSEKDFQKRITDYAKLTGWRVVHIRNVEVGKGRWAVPYEGHSGLPDLILARGGKTILAEIKTRHGKLSLDQLAWLEALGPNGRCWRPEAWDQIVQELAPARRAA